MILYCASDLMWATRIKATAEDVGVAARPVRSLDMLRARLADSPVRSVILDLETPELCFEVLRELRGDRPVGGPATQEAPAGAAGRAIRIVAFGPHVKVDLLQAAKVAGADHVLTRGAFDQRLGELLRELGGAGGAADG